MTTFSSPGDMDQLDPAVHIHIANLAKCGIKWKPPSKQPGPIEASVDETIETSSVSFADPFPLTYKGPKRSSRAGRSVPDLPSEPESESEMMGHAYQEKLLAAKKIQTTLPQGPAISRAEAVKLDAEAFGDLGLKIGEKASELETFVPWRFLVRYAELYVGKANTPTVEPYFDEANIFNTQAWDLFYLYEPETLADGVDPILFVRTSQLEALLRKINKKHGFALTIPVGGNEVKFNRHFPCSTPLPRYLDRTNAFSSYPQLLHSVPLPDPEDDLSKATQADREEFAEVISRCKQSWDGAHGKGKGSKSRKSAVTRYESRKAWGHATKRVQRWLGLREKAAAVVNHAEFTGQEESVTGPMFDANAPAPYEFEDDVIFVCFDNETDENNPQFVTEVGFGILDTRDLEGVPPGEGAENWIKLIEARHLRIKEYLHIRNHKYVNGCPGNFEFGKSEIVGIDRIERTCTKILSPKDADGKPRKIVVVGHDINQDIKLLFGIDVDVYALPGLFDIIDNQRIQQHNIKYKDPQSLAAVLDSLSIEYWYLHNGGNDAVYTLQSMLAMAVRRRQKSQISPKPKLGRHRKPELGDPVLDIGWSTGGEDSDGGSPRPFVDPYAYLRDPHTNSKGISSLTIDNNEN
ncbi:hypothetical protein N0V93_005017 [Gnomoniopsis smithogilvyi]|uniref:Gfd2/YDR514C-like C-terminal domain-containing protein n=1 Tax=Gnomoniopsis smithogilvyi TaxID=1191159 RepID=A0A9W9CXM9_9PEZI|nr:hypothetical protein N0V93_005017 [Gnomoniopsis smithogilvyi]